MAFNCRVDENTMCSKLQIIRQARETEILSKKLEAIPITGRGGL
jgi:hypothetical protein